MKLPLNAFTKTIEMVMRHPIRRATKFLAPNTVVMVTRQRKNRARDNSATLLVTYGKPNYLQRAFVKKCLRAGEPFPVKKILLQPWPVKRTTTKREK